MASKGRGGKREGAGRKPGSKAPATIEQKATLAELAKQHTQTALDTLVRVAKSSSSDAAAVSAATAILDRGYGRPFQSHEHTGKGGGPISVVNLKDLSDDQLAALEPVLAALASSGHDAEGSAG